MAGVTPPDPGVGLWVTIVLACIVLVVGYILYKWYYKLRNASYERRRQKQRDEEVSEGRIARRPNGTLLTGTLARGTEQSPLLAGEAIKSLLACMPREVWVVILSHAANTFPAPYSVHDLEVPTATSSPSIPEVELYRLYSQSMHIKCNLSRVCRSWRTITKRSRFEWVWIASPSQARALGKLILKEEAARVAAIDSCAWWIRKLHIDTTRYTSTVRVLDHNYWYKGTPFISKCPRLVHYRHSMKGKWEPAMVPTVLLGELFPPEKTNIPYNDNILAPQLHSTASNSIRTPSLTTLEWMDMFPFHIYSYLQKNAFDFTNALSQLQHLSIRSFPNHQPYNDMLPQEERPLKLPALHTLKVDDVKALTQPSKWILPSLRSLSISGNVRSTAHQTYITTFLEFHGRRVQELELIAEFSFYDPLRYIEFDRLCPELEILQISARFPWPEFVMKQSTLRRLALLDLEVEAIHGAESGIIKHAREMEQCMPLLEVVQDNGFESDRARRKALEDQETEHAGNILAFYRTMESVLGRARVQFLDWRKLPITSNPAKLAKAPSVAYGYPE